MITNSLGKPHDLPDLLRRQLGIGGWGEDTHPDT
jgi:hypothetical protein